MTNAPLPETRFAFATESVPAEAWQVVRFTAREKMSALYEAVVVVAMEPGGGSLENLLGAGAVLGVFRGDRARHLRGVVRQVEELGSTAAHRFVRVEVVPVLWTLSQRSDSRIFQQMNVLAIVREVLRVAGVYQGDGAFDADASLGALAPREYCVQYQETDLDFVQRLLEEEGIPFYFRHDGAGSETLTLAGDTHVYAPAPTLDGGPIQVLGGGTPTHAVETARWFDERHRLQPTSVTVRDFDFSRPRTSMSPSHPARPGARTLYEFPARASLTHYDEGARTYQTENTAKLARVRSEAFQTRAHEGSGRSNVSGFLPGCAFTLEGHEQPEMNRTYLLVEVEHLGQAWTELPEDVSASERLLEALRDAGVPVGGEGARGRVERYANRFVTQRISGIETSVPFRPERTIARPIVEGPQTAWVVGPPGEEIHTDPHGRIKVQFHWDRLGQNDDRSSCWIRVAQSSSGAGWGFTVLPRIGMEVVVSFLEGDPDRPMITACVNNGENGTSYPLPEMKTKSVIKTWSSPRTGGYNEVRFEDAAGQEQMYVQAERDHDTLVKHDQTVTVQRHRTKLVQGDEHNTIEQNRITHVVMDNTRYVDGNQEVEVHGGVGHSMSVDNDHELRVGVNQSKTVGKNSTVRIGENHDTTVGQHQTLAVLGNQEVEVHGDAGHWMSVDNDHELQVGGEQKLTVAKSLFRDVGGNSIANYAQSYLRTVTSDQIVNVLQNSIRNTTADDYTVIGGAKTLNASSVFASVTTSHKTVAGQTVHFEVSHAPPASDVDSGKDDGQAACGPTILDMIDGKVCARTPAGASITAHDKTIVLDAGPTITVSGEATAPETASKKIVFDTGAGAKIVMEDGKITLYATDGIVIEAAGKDLLLKGTPKVKLNPDP